MTSCVVCQKSLVLRVEEEERDEDLADASENSLIDDDVHLTCNCHFHWQCLLDSTYEIADCPNCKTDVTSIDSNGSQRLICNLNNEGGLQIGQDIIAHLD